jgi:hypothetical protein
MSDTPTASWHVPDTLLREYAEERVRDVDAWSIEAHLGQCSRCTGELVLLVADTGAGTLVTAVLPRLLEDLPAQLRAPRPTAIRGTWVLATSGTGARWAWLAAVAVTVIAAATLDALSATGPQGVGNPAVWLSPGGVLLVVAPLLPVLGVALSYGTFDPVHEVVASTPSGGLRLMLWRTLAVLAVSMPALLVAGFAIGLTAPVAWLLPALALTALTLALGSFVELSKASLGVGAGWLLAVIGPGLAGSAPVLLEARATPLWLALVLFGGAAVVTRRDAYSPRPLPLLQEIS